MALTAKGARTRERIIAGAAEHLRGQDPGGVTLDDLRAVTRTSKSQIFHYFPGGKEELFLAIARYEADQVLADQQPHLACLDSWAAWEQWREVLVARYRAQGRSCPLALLMTQVGDVPGAADVVSSLMLRWQHELERGIATMQASGSVRAALDPATTAAALIAGIQGGVAVLRSTGELDHLDAVLDVMFEHLRRP